MMLVYVDDLICVSHDPKATMQGVQRTFKLKDDKVEPPSDYLGASLAHRVIDGQPCWVMSSHKYIDSAIQNVEDHLSRINQRLPTKCKTPLSHGYRPELDVSQELSADDMRYYQELIGVLRWAVELGRCDIAVEVSMMSTHMAMP